jgi:hypothetical protein
MDFWRPLSQITPRQLLMLANKKTQLSLWGKYNRQESPLLLPGNFLTPRCMMGMMLHNGMMGMGM